ncbi:TlpA family protein disulfide reductase [Rhodoligotrophos defluvii]|uniref:TlpA family protein disulfide reductase n=1 Tax=Rhodoligotrophos defluvii TaxID=2561934 RepID=UPI0010C96CA9|nr:TlpA disulfide reductase family protein [Rhodoligotrophos defluvii]
MKTALIAAATSLLVFSAVAVGLYWYQERPMSASPPSVTTGVSSPQASFAFTLLEEPRPLPAVDFIDGDGRTMTLADFRGKVVLLNIWATWCVPCREEMPTLDRLQAELGGPEFQVVALSIDRAGLDIVRAFYDETGIKHLAMYLDSSGKASRELGTVGLPTTLLVDREGRELGRLVGPAEWDSPEVVAFIRGHLERKTGSRVLPRTARTASPRLPDAQSLAAAHIATGQTSAPQ